jgi:hypothetical protein
MKIRNCHVSNSSTSSFIIAGNISKEDIADYFSVELTEPQIRRVEKELTKFTWNGKDKVFLTTMVIEEWNVSDIMYACPKKWEGHTYSDGTWGHPYGKEKFEVIGGEGFSKVWLRKEKV